ncbi:MULTISPECIES: protein-export chaperone SecB [Spongiibacter]|jgi:preprotein translocase subunit SecB|uniref:protein-export chaperone SecB n=2 Tax=Spongiibacteraceae TaxID=1706375 RepID=UPI000C6BBFEB|nr:MULTISPECIES: protein-export chaperone SecB [Spongiibacter]MAY38634.1 protein-export chaperone SecB [Spongiibacter sp.]MBI58859.1 protein-export chaperone SecB [Spongiibacter sp.]MBU73461.1 protein-export chaperone SecB [Spongiibacter sp.]|tara:strand:+ start:14338 stop:14832 length:495 start_codon:yes stop_codon:yes gene_type:complete
MAEQDNAQAQQTAPKFALQRLYVKDSSFESPSSPAVFSKVWKPKMHVDLNTRSQPAAENVYEVTLTVTVTAKLEEDETAFLVEVQQAGLFIAEGIEGEALTQLLGIACPNMLFPYVREAVDALAVKGGFPALALQPVNFEALYRQAKQQAEQKAAEAGDSATTH